MKKQILMEKKDIQKIIKDFSESIIADAKDIANIAVIGIRTNGEFLASRLTKKIKTKTNIEIPLGILDITLYRDDLSMQQPTIHKTNIPFDIQDKEIILVDDVLFTGRTIRAALDAIIDFGRPKKIKLMVLIDRGNRELPIKADYIGKYVETNINDDIEVQLKELGKEDIALLEKK